MNFAHTDFNQKAVDYSAKCEPWSQRVRLLGNEHSIADDATIIGSLTLRQRCSIWYNVVIRGDYDPITIHEETNVQDGVVLHADPGFPLLIGRRVTEKDRAMVEPFSNEYLEEIRRYSTTLKPDHGIHESR